MGKNKTVDEFILKHKEWQKELIELRKILKATELHETIKWGMPVYTVSGKNVVGFGAFKKYVGLWFFQGALLSDKNNNLINAQDDKTVSMRQWRFNSFEEIDKQLITEYVNEAASNEKKGKKIKFEKKPLNIPIQLLDCLNNDIKLAKSFEELSLSCKRQYADYISEAKREETKLRRLEKIKPMILSKAGLHDKYKN